MAMKGSVSNGLLSVIVLTSIRDQAAAKVEIKQEVNTEKNII